jgi:hypothetical protein
MRRSRGARQAEAASLELTLPLGRLTWEEGRIRVLALPLAGDTLLLVELGGAGRLELDLADSLEQVALRASLGRHAAGRRLKRATLVLDRLPPSWEDLDWRPLRPALPWLPLPGFADRRRLDRPHPDNPLLQPAAAGGRLWLHTDPGGLELAQHDGQAWLQRQLRPGSSLDLPITCVHVPGREGAPWRPGPDPSWLPPCLHEPAPLVDSLWLDLEADGSRLGWTLTLDLAEGGTPLWLLLDARARLERAEWLSGSGSARSAVHSRGRSIWTGSPWLLVEREEGRPAGARLLLSGSSPRGAILQESPGQRRATRANWFPRLPWPAADEPVLRSTGADLPVLSVEAGADLGLNPQRLIIEERPREDLGPELALCWTPLRQRAARHQPASVQAPHQAGDIGNLELPRERQVRPPSHEEPAEPVDLVQGRDTLALAILGERPLLEELSKAAARLHAWLGPLPQPVHVLERVGTRPGRREEEERLAAHGLPPHLPLEVNAQDLRSPLPEARLARLEALCRAWWLPATAEDEAAPRWIRWGAARACALLLIEEQQGSGQARDLRQGALASELAAFRSKVAASLPALGERAEGGWQSAEVQERHAWRFALLLEHLRWRMRDPETLDDAAYRAFLRDLMDRLREPLDRRRPLHELKSAMADFLVANGLLERSGFGDAPTVWAWLDGELSRSRVPVLRVTPGRVDSPEGPRVALRAVWDQTPPPHTVLPVLLRTVGGWSAWSLKAAAREEHFVLPVDPAELRGLEVAPGGSLRARIKVD